jgi:hypothetical protein
MSRHKLVDLQKVIDEKIGSLKEEVEIGTSVKLNPLYIADRKDEVDFLQWIKRVIQPILNRDIDDHQQLGVTEKRLEMMQTTEFENTLQKRIQELKLKLKDSDDLRESDILINEIDTLESTLGRLMDLKACGIEIAETNHNFKQANRIRKQFVKMHDTEDEIRAQRSKTESKWAS